MTLPILLVSTLALTLGVTFLLWLLSLAMKDVSIVDIFWGVGFVLIAWWSVGFSDDSGARSVLVATLVTIWGLRLAGYLAWRNLGHGEDPRYRKMREKSPETFWWKSLFVVFWLQAGLMWFISMPLQLAARTATDLYWLDGIAAAVWLCGLFFEAVGDFQLARFKQRRSGAGEVMDQGLWKYTRHPNYFGDFLVWWGYYLFAVAAGSGWWTVGSPLVMSLLLMKFSGVGLLEKSLRSDKPEYEQYAQRTNAFFPGPRSANS